MRVKLILTVFIVAALLLLHLITPEIYTGYDGSFYAAMTRERISDNVKTTSAPYCYRLLPAWLLNFIPLPTETSFLVYNTVISAVSMYLLFFLFKNTGYSYLEAALGTFFFAFSWVNIRLHFLYPILVDATYYLIIILTFLSFSRRSDFLFLIALTLGALTRENFLSFIPVYYFYRRTTGRIWDAGAFRKTVTLAAGPIILFVLLRIIIPNTNPDFGYWKTVTYYARMSFLYRTRVIYSYFNVYGMAIFIILLHPRTVFHFLRHNSYLTVYLLISIIIPLFTGWDVSRYNFFSFPVILLLALQAMKEHRVIYLNKLMIGFLIAAQLILMRVLHPMTTANYRQIWWVCISFCPESVFRQSLLRCGLVGVAFLIIYAGLYLKIRGSVFKAHGGSGT
jgi:hypothetical protein